ncbi:MAG: hypothetical protein E7016_06595 [Alphaproteobacteria bacterium]|nr:hypothetical protein [Alphaproteobacteria bacterium]
MLIKFCLGLCAFLMSFYIGNSSAQSVENEKAELNQNSYVAVPKCNDANLYEKVLQRVKQYSDISDADSAIVKRQKALLIKNIESFEDVDVKSFNPETDFNTANALISLKINKQLTNDDIVLCKQAKNIKKPLYIIVYPQDKAYVGHIINLEQYSADYEKISFTYP